MKKNFLIICITIFFFTPIFAQDVEKPEANKPAGFHKSETRSFIVEVSNTMPKTFLRECHYKIQSAEAFFSQIFKMPAGILTGDLNENSVAFTKFSEKLKSESRFRGKVPKNIYEEWFGLAGKVHFRIWDKRALFADEWFDIDKVPAAEREKRGVPGAYIAWGKFGTAPTDKELGKRIIRSYVGSRQPKEVLASLYHEIGHLYLISYLMDFSAGIPAWINEGFAELFAYALPSDKKTKRKIERNKAVLYELVQTGEYWKFDSFLEVNNAHNLKLVADKSVKSEIIYTQAWSVIEFLTSSPQYSTKFLKFLEELRFSHFSSNLLTSGKKTSMFELQKTCFKEAFGTDITNLEKYWVKYVNIRYKSDLDKHPEYNFYIGDFYLRRGNIPKAQEFFGLAAEKAPKFAESHLGLGRLAYTQKNFEEATIHFEAAIKADPENSDGYTWLGWSFAQAGKFKEANTTFEKGIEIDGDDDEDILNGYGLSLFYTENYEKSAATYEKAYDKTKNPNYLFGQGKSLFMMKEYTSSRRLFSALSTTMDHPEIPFWIGAASAHLKDKDYALTELAKATKTNHRYVNYAKAFVDALNNETPLPEIKP